MKTLKIMIIALLAIHCKAQNPIIAIEDADGFPATNIYYKDINDLLNPFEGTYVYTNGTTSFKMVLVKKVQQYNGRYYEDLIIGEYQYIENGVEKANTLSNLNIVYNNQSIKHAISGNLIVDNNFRMWKCPTCPTNEKRFNGGIKDVTTERGASITMRRTVEAGQEVMKIKISHVMGVALVEGQPAPPDFSLPQGEFTLIKQ